MGHTREGLRRAKQNNKQSQQQHLHVDPSTRKGPKEGPTHFSPWSKETMQVAVDGSDSPVDVTSFVRSHEASSERLRSKVRGLVFPVAESPERNPALEERRAFLRRRNEERQYARMMASVKKPTNPHDGAGKSLKVQATVGANVFVAALASFYVGYLVSGGLVDRTSTRVVIGLGAMVFILFVEMILFMIRTYTVDTVVQRKIGSGRYQQQKKTKDD